MRIEGASQQAEQYNSSTSKPVKVEKQVEPISNPRTHSLEIKEYVNQHLGYKPTIQEKLIIESIETANKKMLGPKKEFEFAIHKQTKQIMVKVIDKETKEILREIPPEKVLDAVAHMCELAGIFMDEKR
ncbi:MAG TPA: flagellar protein FlaG [Epulopiscium sp.]|nr:flagellar protein FlaG [Candidatus Epulonipiscium sp.]